jgi:molecular chaperone DnaK
LAGIDAGMEALNAAWQAASQEMYAAGNQADAQAGEQPNAGGNESEVTDVNYEEVK